MKGTHTREEFLKMANEAHNGKYSYLNVPERLNLSTKVDVLCKEHGVFRPTFRFHVVGKTKCPKCVGNVKYTQDEFVKKLRKELPENISTEKVVYEGSNEKITLVCDKHGEFEKFPSEAKNGCPECNKEARREKNKNKFLKKAKEVHGDTYDYSKVDYIDTDTKVTIICKEHGEFLQTPYKHINGQGCPKCGLKKIGEKKRKPFKDFVKKARAKHGSKYEYVRESYTKVNDFLDIMCQKHGKFSQIGANHLVGCGCPSCSKGSTSKDEKELASFLEEIVPIETNDRKILGGKEIDIVIPSKKLAIEYNGLFWHSDVNKDDNYHIEKTKESESKGYRMIHVFSDEWINKKEVVKSRLLNIVGKTPNIIYARKCTIKEVPTKEAMEFLDKNHLQGRVGATIKIGLYNNNELVSLMTFGNQRKNLGNKSKEGYFELLRFCNKLNTSVVGGASKLMNYFERKYRPKSVLSYADRRWSDGKLYEKLGFDFDGATRPNYFYTKGDIRENRYTYRKSELLKKKMGEEHQTEREIMKNNGYLRVYDCGTYRFIKTYS